MTSRRRLGRSWLAPLGGRLGSRGLLLLLILVGASISLRVQAPIAQASSTQRLGPNGTAGSKHATLLQYYYEELLASQDEDTFSVRVATRLDERSLCALLSHDTPEVRRAAVLALGKVGSIHSNRTLANALKDADPLVRSLTIEALWSIWFRADTPENNAMLERVVRLSSQQRFSEAEQLATRLITRAPKFAEAYNQRAIVLFQQGRYAASAADCRRTLEINPYHFGALSGLGQCYLRLDQRAEALETFRRALELQPYSVGLRQTVAALEFDSE